MTFYYFYNLPIKIIDQLKASGWHSSDIQEYGKYYSKKISIKSNGGRNGYRDSDRSKVYKSEWAFEKKVVINKFKSINDAQKFLKKVVASKCWENIGGRKNLWISVPNRRSNSFAGRAHYGGEIELNESCGMNEYTLLHEIAHQAPNSMHHSIEFRINLLKLVSRFMGREAAAILKSEFQERKLKLSMPKPRSPETWLKSKRHMEKVRASKRSA